ncbi:MAG: DNA damage-inducible protein I [Candidatus Erwinia impunctatus]|nr:DNA damage-inducible protein I [Culicoides impunctatus]
MRVEITVAKTTLLLAGAIDALAVELTKRIEKHFPEQNSNVSVRYAAANNLTVLGASHAAKEQITEILQETWESADDWFSGD